MDTVEFIEERRRMCNFYSNCTACPGEEDSEFCGFNVGSGISAKEQVDIVEKWSKEHPCKDKTRQSVFLERHPDVRLDDDGIVIFFPCDFDKYYKQHCDVFSDCDTCRRDYWNKEVK